MRNFANNFGNIGNFANNFGNMINQGPGGFDFSAFINNMPKESVKGTDGNLKDLIQQNRTSVIKKILKSNYSELVKKYKQNGGKWTDPDFPPDQTSIGNV